MRSVVMRRSSLKGAIERRHASGGSCSPGSRTLNPAWRYPSDNRIRRFDRTSAGGSMHLPRGQNERGAGASACWAGPPSSGQTIGFEFNLSRQSADGGDMSDVDAIRWLASEHDLEFVDLDTYGVDPAAGEILPAPLARRHHVVAIKRKFGTPVIATADPDDLIRPGDGPGQHRAGLHLGGCLAGPDRRLPRPTVRTGGLERAGRTGELSDQACRVWSDQISSRSG